MKPAELLAALPDWSEASPDQLIAAPAWTLPCRFGETPGVMKLDAIRPTDTINLAVKLEDEEHVLGLSDSPLFRELHAVWPSRADIPEPIILALVEKECGPLLQLLENAVRRQLSIVGLAQAQAPDSLAFRIVSSGNDLVTFTLSTSTMLVKALGELRFIDIAHPSIRARELSTEVELAAFALSPGDVPETGDALVLPELDPLSDSAAVRLIADGRFAISAETGVATWSDDGLWRVLSRDSRQVSFGAVADLASGKASWADIPELAALGGITSEMPLKLVRNGTTTASGRLIRIGASLAFAIDAVS